MPPRRRPAQLRALVVLGTVLVVGLATYVGTSGPSESDEREGLAQEISNACPDGVRQVERNADSYHIVVVCTDGSVKSVEEH